MCCINPSSPSLRKTVESQQLGLQCRKLRLKWFFHCTATSWHNHTIKLWLLPTAIFQRHSLLGFLVLQRLHCLQCVMNSWFCIDLLNSKAWSTLVHLQHLLHWNALNNACWPRSASNFSLRYQNLSQSCIFWEPPASKLLLCFVVHLLCSNLHHLKNWCNLLIFKGQKW